jgi:hypothetical protein
LRFTVFDSGHQSAGSFVTERFTAFDLRHQSVGSFVIELTGEPARTCIAGTWFKARPVFSDLKVVGFDLSEWWKDPSLYPSYSIEGRLMTVELNGGKICDAYPEVEAELGKRVALGFLQWGGPLKYVGIYARDKDGRVLIQKLP